MEGGLGCGLDVFFECGDDKQVAFEFGRGERGGAEGDLEEGR